MPRRITEKEIRAKANLASTISKLLDPSYLIFTEAKEVYKADLQGRKVIDQCYHPPKRMKFQAKTNLEDVHASCNSWEYQMRVIEDAFSASDMKTFYALIQKCTKIKQASAIVRGILDGDGQVHLTEEEVNSRIAAYFGSYSTEHSIINNSGMPNSNLTLEDFTKPAFTLEEIYKAMEDCNFSKAIGLDGFDGTILKKNMEIRVKIAEELRSALNIGKLPEYFTQDRLVPLSKCRGSDVAEVECIRPIVIRSHLSKVSEKAIYNKITANHSQLLRTRLYQTGFQAGKSTHLNLANIIERIAQEQRAPSKRTLKLFIDLQQAYNSVSRLKIEQTLLSRCKSKEVLHIAKLILQLHMKQKIHIGNYTFDSGAGVAQGSVLSLFLFNILLEEALLSSPILTQLILRGDLMAYADDLVILSSSSEELRIILKEFDKLTEEWGLKLNRKKCIILKRQDDSSLDDIDGVVFADKVKYLGMNLSSSTNIISQEAKTSIKRNLYVLKGKLRTQCLEVKEAVLMSYCRSLLIYFATPLVMAGKRKQPIVTSLEKELIRELNLLPKDINRDAIINIAQLHLPAWQTIDRLAKQVNFLRSRQQKITQFIQHEQTLDHNQGEIKAQRKRLYIPKDIATIIWAASRNSSCINFKHHHFCQTHKCKVDVSHLQQCSLVDSPIDIASYIKLVKQKNIRDWSEDLILEAVIGFRLLYDSIRSLEASKQWIKRKEEWNNKKHPRLDSHAIIGEPSNYHQDSVMKSTLSIYSDDKEMIEYHKIQNEGGEQTDESSTADTEMRDASKREALQSNECGTTQKKRRGRPKKKASQVNGQTQITQFIASR